MTTLTEMTSANLHRAVELAKHIYSNHHVNLHFTTHALQRSTDGNIDKNGFSRGDMVNLDIFLEHYTHILASFNRISDIYKDMKSGALPNSLFAVYFEDKPISEDTYLEICQHASENEGEHPKFNFTINIVFTDDINDMNSAGVLTIVEDHHNNIESINLVIKTIMVSNRFKHPETQLKLRVPSRKGNVPANVIDYMDKYADFGKKIEFADTDDEAEEHLIALDKHSTEFRKLYGMHFISNL